ncbi:pentapeptide repeat-containing protein, partial [Listeria monocytogenes]|nr:pentapeptide repeat-containing protein [Listeria monocytogenes]
MNQAELDVVIEKHEKWLRDGYGERADLSGANLRGANLSYANLSYADLRRADLS